MRANIGPKGIFRSLSLFPSTSHCKTTKSHGILMFVYQSSVVLIVLVTAPLETSKHQRCSINQNKEDDAIERCDITALFGVIFQDQPT